MDSVTTRRFTRMSERIWINIRRREKFVGQVVGNNEILILYPIYFQQKSYDFLEN
jgi:hypothetical protein